MTATIIYLILPFIFCSSDYQVIRIWMKDVSSIKINGVTDDSLFLSVDFNFPKLLSPDFRYGISDVLEKQPRHRYLKNDDDFRIYGNRHWNQQVFRFLPDAGLILSERFPDMALTVVSDYLQLVEKKTVPYNWKWEIKRSRKFPSLDELRHSHFELDHFLIDYFNTTSNLTNSTHVTVDDIQPGFINTENKFTGFKQNITEIQSIIEQKKEIEQPKKKNTKIKIFISVIVILIIIGIFVKIGCFRNFAMISSNQRSSVEQTSDENINN